MKKKLTLSLFLCASIATATAHADELTPAKKADIIKLLNLNGTERIVEPFSLIVTQGYMQALGNCPTCSPKIPDVVRTETQAVLRAHVNGEDGLIERQIPVYQQRFTHAEIKQLLAFYGSPIGHKMVTESNELMRDSIGVSQQWGRDLSPEIRKQIDVALTKAGIKPPAPSTPPPSVLQPQAPAK